MIRINTVAYITPEMVDQSSVNVVERTLSNDGWSVVVRKPHRGTDPLIGGMLAVAHCDTKEEADAMALNIKDILYARLSCG